MQGDRVSFHRLVRKAGVLVMAALTLAACAETQLAVHTAKRVGGTADASAGAGAYKVGKPYQIAGQWYYPKEDFSYVEEGIASWYGPNFHGKATANGEIYNMNDLTAAHRTLPMPSIVRVTNLENGRALVLRVNDRGPFAKERIIDVSRRAAQLLGFEGQGTARVRVEILPEESIALRDAILNGGSEGVAIASATVPTPEVTPIAHVPDTEQTAAADTKALGAGAEPVATQLLAPPPDVPVSRMADADPPRERVIIPAPIPPSMGSIGDSSPANVAAVTGDTYIQAGAFSSIDNARALEANLRSFGPTVVTPVDLGGTTLYRVRLGPLDDAFAAQRMLDRMASAGYGNAVVVTD